MSKNRPQGAKKKYTKICQFPGCGDEYEGIGASKYCDEHQKPEYKKILADMKLAKDQDMFDFYNESNIEIHHNYGKSTPTLRICPCGKQYTLVLFPGVSVYSGFCEEHRVPHRREILRAELKAAEDASTTTRNRQANLFDIFMTEDLILSLSGL